MPKGSKGNTLANFLQENNFDLDTAVNRTKLVKISGWEALKDPGINPDILKEGAEKASSVTCVIEEKRGEVSVIGTRKDVQLFTAGGKQIIYFTLQVKETTKLFVLQRGAKLSEWQGCYLKTNEPVMA